MVKLKMEEQEVLKLIEEAENKIVNLIKSGKIKEQKEEKLSSNRLMSYAKENNVKITNVIKDMTILSSYEKIALTLSLNEKITNKKIASALNMNEKEVIGIIDTATDKVIDELSKTNEKEDALKEIIKEEKEPLEKQEEPKKENKKEEKKKEEKEYVKTSLNEVLLKNKISRSDFIKNLNNLNMNDRRMVRDYFGLGLSSLSIEEMSKRYDIKAEDVNKTINGIVGSMLKKKDEKVKKDDKKEKEQSKLDKFLTVNKITKEQFMSALSGLSLEEKSIVSMYFGIGQKEKSLAEIAVLTKTNPLKVKMDLQDILKNINKAVKKKDDKKPVDNLEQLYDNARLKLSSMSKLLLTNAAFMMYLSTNPIMQNMLYTITNFNYDLDMASKMLGMTKEGVVSSLNTLSTVCYGYMADMKQNKSSGFTDDSEKEREIGRRY